MFRKALLLAGFAVGLGVCAVTAPAQAALLPALTVATPSAPVVQVSYWHNHHRYYHRRWRAHRWYYY